MWQISLKPNWAHCKRKKVVNNPYVHQLPGKSFIKFKRRGGYRKRFIGIPCLFSCSFGLSSRHPVCFLHSSRIFFFINWPQSERRPCCCDSKAIVWTWTSLAQPARPYIRWYLRAVSWGQYKWENLFPLNAAAIFSYYFRRYNWMKQSGSGCFFFVVFFPQALNAGVWKTGLKRALPLVVTTVSIYTGLRGGVAVGSEPAIVNILNRLRIKQKALI